MDGLEVLPQNMDPRFPERKEEGGFGFARASGGLGAQGWGKIRTA